MGDVLLNDTPVRKYAGWYHDVECHLDSLSFLHAVINESNNQTAQVRAASLSPQRPPSLPMKTALLTRVQPRHGISTSVTVLQSILPTFNSMFGQVGSQDFQQLRTSTENRRTLTELTRH